MSEHQVCFVYNMAIVGSGVYLAIRLDTMFGFFIPCLFLMNHYTGDDFKHKQYTKRYQEYVEQCEKQGVLPKPPKLTED